MRDLTIKPGVTELRLALERSVLVSIHSRLLSRELPGRTACSSATSCCFNPLPVIKPGVTVGQRAHCWDYLPFQSTPGY
ncbi:protein of unknown function [Methylocaldum szegediense]|uniref:Uncharacterized protein n=1 Tax=Methylocaldum szegediense TaxID=73780 RepID=A0ABM9I1S5_9GAMM|nr:protein of unknown function [Methylocaldum szegediense]